MAAKFDTGEIFHLSLDRDEPVLFVEQVGEDGITQLVGFGSAAQDFFEGLVARGFFVFGMD